MGTDKGLLDFNGKAMITYAIDLLSGVFKIVLISSNNAEYEKFGFNVITDIHQNCGPIGGLHALLKHIDTEYAFVLGCDMPFVDKKAVIRLLRNNHDHQIVIPRQENKLEPLCAVYSKWLLAEIEKRIQIGNYKLVDLIENANTQYVDFETENTFVNINSRSDLYML